MEAKEVWIRAHREADLWLRRCGDTWTRAHREDLAQEASIAAWRWATDGLLRGHLWAAVQTITKRIRSRAMRTERRREPPPPFVDWIPPEHEGPPERWYVIAGRRVPASRASRWLSAALSRLDPFDRQVLLAFYEGFCCAELAERFRRSMSCVKTRLHRARRRVQKEIEGCARDADHLE